MNKQEYSSSIKKTPFNYLLSKKMGALIDSGMLYPEIYKKCFDENYIGIESLQRRREVTNVLYERLNSLDSTLLHAFVNDSISTSRFLLVYAIAKTDRLFSEFLLSVFRDAVSGQKEKITLSDFDDFFISVQEKNVAVSKWSPKTIDDIGTSYRNILVESGLCRRVRKTLIPTRPVVSPLIAQHIDQIGDHVYLQALLGAN